MRTDELYVVVLSRPDHTGIEYLMDTFMFKSGAIQRIGSIGSESWDDTVVEKVFKITKEGTIVHYSVGFEGRIVLKEVAE